MKKINKNEFKYLHSCSSIIIRGKIAKHKRRYLNLHTNKKKKEIIADIDYFLIRRKKRNEKRRKRLEIEKLSINQRAIASLQRLNERNCAKNFTLSNYIN